MLCRFVVYYKDVRDSHRMVEINIVLQQGVVSHTGQDPEIEAAEGNYTFCLLLTPAAPVTS